MASIWKYGAGIVLAGGLALGGLLHHRHGTRAALTNMLEFSSPAEAAVPPTVIGMNMGANNYYNATWIFDDFIQTSGELRLYRNGWEYITDQIKFDATGHPIDVPAGTTLILIAQQAAPRTQVGTFRYHMSKGWELQPVGSLTLDGSGPNFKVISTKPTDSAIAFSLKAWSNHASLNELSCHSEHYDPAQPFNPLFLADIKPYRVIRFMDWMQTNNAPPRVWSERPTPQFLTQAGKQGVALEHMVALANTSKADPWFNLPLDADPAYYRAFATYVRDHLAPDRKAYVELSNEVWNTAFQQGKDAETRGRVLYPDADPGKANDLYYADRVRDLMAIWSSVFAGQEQRLVRVLATQAVNPSRAEQALAHKDTWRSVDALATAPYFAPAGLDLNAVAGSRVDAIFKAAPKLVDEAIEHALQNKRVAARYHLRYIAYEGGPDFSIGRVDFIHDFEAANEDPRIEDIYRRYLHRWQTEIGDVLVLYTSHATGVFGHQHYTGQPLDEAPRAKVVREFIPK